MNEPAYTEERPAYKELSLGQWLLTLLLIAIPIVNLIVLCIWAFGGDNPRKKFSQAYLIWIGISIVIGVIFALISIFFFSNVVDDSYYYY